MHCGPALSKTLSVLTVILCLIVGVASAKTNHQDVYQQSLEEAFSDQYQKELRAFFSAKDIRHAKKLKEAILDIKKRRPKKALKTLKKLPKSFLLKEHVTYYKAKALLDTKSYSNVLKTIKKFSKPPTSQISWELYWLRLEALAHSKDMAAITQELKVIARKLKKDRHTQIRSHYIKGLAFLAKKQKQQAFKEFRKVVVDKPGSLIDEKIFAINKKFLNRSAQNKRAQNLAETGFALEAEAIWQKLHDSAAKKSKPYYQEKIAYAAFKGRNYKVAAKRYEAVLEQKNTAGEKLKIYNLLSKAYTRSDAFEKAIATNKLIIKKYPKTNLARLAKFRLGFLYFDSEQYGKAIKEFAPYAQKGSRVQKRSAQWYRFWSFYLTKKQDPALKELEALKLTYKRDKNMQSTLSYWEARIYEQKKQKQKAKALYQKLSTQDPLDYTTLLARQRLKFHKLNKDTVINKSLLTSIIGKPKEVSLKNLRTKLGKNAPLKKALLLKAIGEDLWAYDQSQQSPFIRTIPNRKTALLFQKAGNFRRGYVLRKMAWAGKVAGMTPKEGYILAFPRAYHNFVEPFAKLWGMDALLAYAIMRQESVFTPQVVSRAYAYGLMQIIPPTAQDIAKQIDFKDFHSDDLKTPGVNTLFGTYYIKHLAEIFPNDLIANIGSYNAGPDALKRWKKKTGLKADEFIELIPYKETKKYVKKVLVNYLVYQQIYRP